jgi:hypothetical protein
MEPDESNQYLAPHAVLLLESLRRWTGRDLFPELVTVEQRTRALYEAPFAVVSHNTATDPIFNYANRAALTLFEMTWAEFTSLPSRLSAEPVHRDERARLMAEVTRNGFIAHYAGIRIAKTGRRFRIEDAIVWNIIDDADAYHGQAAMFDHWHFLP